MSLPIIYVQIVEEGRIIELRLESFDMADDLAKTIKALPAVTRVLSEWRWVPEPKTEAAIRYPVREEVAADAGEEAIFQASTGRAGVTHCAAYGCPRVATHYYNHLPYCRYHGRGKKGAQA